MTTDETIEFLGFPPRTPEEIEKVLRDLMEDDCEYNGWRALARDALSALSRLRAERDEAIESRDAAVKTRDEWKAACLKAKGAILDAVLRTMGTVPDSAEEAMQVIHQLEASPATPSPEGPPPCEGRPEGPPP